MNFTATRLPYRQTGYFSEIAKDYLDKSELLQPFYKHAPTIDGVKSAIHARKQFNTNRELLVEQLKKQYEVIESSSAVKKNIEKLSHDNCFTVTTAHQPAIFTGTLFFVYKILHIIKLSSQLKKELPEYEFVPVFYMGSEDADMDELGNIYLGNEKLIWDTDQKGAVGRMHGRGLEKIIDRIEGEYSVLPFGKELIQLLKDCYLDCTDVQTATFKLVDRLFAAYGLIVLIPDNIHFKKLMVPVFQDDIFHHTPMTIANATIEKLSANYDVQANPRPINLFYLKDDIRERIVEDGERFKVYGHDIFFTKDEMLEELQQHPDRFSPNVILRGLFQSTILPDIAFVGGGGETAYWLELKNIFEHYKVPYPVLILRNSFLVLEKKWREKLDKAGISIEDIFKSEDELVNELVKKESTNQLGLDKEIEEANNYYEKLKQIALPVDPTLTQYVEALQSKAVKPLMDLEKKLLKAEKRKFEVQRAHIQSVKSALFPLNNLQERIENFMPYYAQWGSTFIDQLYQHSLSLEQEFVILEEV
ncbi:MAG: bacillithiol biosynthesis cysteine-adding enzyme BshC [Bacteroidetes bacterium]|nr:bacillithiol biosynthesis cysteine-adding enzyme BshC [Bacteroidota bacterium]